jgi:hypothetical protein
MLPVFSYPAFVRGSLWVVSRFAHLLEDFLETLPANCRSVTTAWGQTVVSQLGRRGLGRVFRPIPWTFAETFARPAGYISPSVSHCGPHRLWLRARETQAVPDG